MDIPQRVPAYVPLFGVTRGPLVESVHYGAFAVVDRQGHLLAAAGPIMVPVFMRSSAKPFQVMPLLEDGGADRWALTDEEIAVMAASHSGTERHVAVIQGLHQRLGLGPQYLQCGVHPPLHRDSALALRMAGQEPTPYHHNCSGKHTGMLALALLHGWPLETYLDLEHPVQQRIRHTVAEMAGMSPEDVLIGIDGCSAPNFALPLYHAAWAYARLVDPQDLPEPRRGAARRVVQAMMAQPFMVAGPERFDTRVMEALPGKLVAKGGAEGYQGIGLLPGVAGEQGIGIAIKIADGDGRRRAASAVALEILRRLGVLTEEAAQALSDLGPQPPVRNIRGDVQVGQGKPLF